MGSIGHSFELLYQKLRGGTFHAYLIIFLDFFCQDRLEGVGAHRTCYVLVVFLGFICSERAGIYGVFIETIL